MFLLYSLIYCIALILILPFEYLKRPEELRKRWLREKFGFFTPPYPPLNKGGNGGVIWIHAVSVGEVIAAVPLLKRLGERYRHKKIILSTITDTGQKVAKERVPDGTVIVYLPFDLPLIIRRVIKKIKPALLIVIETELWPNLFRIFKKNNIPVVLLNGRISDKSFSGYKKISFFMKRVLAHVDFFGMQNEEYAERIRSFGVNKDKVVALGNFKFETRPPSQIPEWTQKIKGHVITAGSTHEGEEELISFVYLELKKGFPDLNLIIAPRHPERFQAVENVFRSKGLPFSKRSTFSIQHIAPLDGEGRDGGKTPNSELQTFAGTIILLDTVGELSSIYGISDIVIIGKSFRGHGGQNPFEAAFWGKPIVCGPHMENFPVIQDFYKVGAAIEVREEELYSKLKELLSTPEKAKDIGLKAQELYRKNSGAVERAMKIIQRYIS